MAKISKHDKHFWKLITLILVILNTALLTILIGLIYEEKIYDNKIVAFEDNSYSRNVKEIYFGNASAEVTLVLYADFECPYCKRFHKKIYTKLKEEYIDTGLAKLVFRHYPKIIAHKSALIEAEAFECAKEQDLAYEIYPYLYAEKRLAHTDLLHIAEKIGLEIPQFEECLFIERYRNDILDEKARAEMHNIETTPTLVINGEDKIEGVKPYFIYQEAINEELGY